MHRHSGSRAVNVCVLVNELVVILKVQDFGKGIPGEVLDRLWKSGNVGVGLAGIRERLKELGGFLEIESNVEGTLLKATIPVSSSEVRNEDRSPVQPSREAPSAFPAD